MLNLKNLGLLVIGNFILACSVQWFVVPYDIPVGGATGISLIIANLSGYDMELIVFIINLACLPIAYFKSGKSLFFGSILSSLIYPFCLYIVNYLPNLTCMSDGILLGTILAGILSGIGVGFVIKMGASTGGMDIVAIVLSHMIHYPLSLVMGVMDACIMLGQTMYIEPSHVTYGVISAYLMAKMIDQIIHFGEPKYQLNIISPKTEQIKDALIQADQGITFTLIESGLQGKTQKSIMSVIDGRRLSAIEKIVLQIDPTAFITIQKVYDVKGRGYTLPKVNIERNRKKFHENP